MKDTIGQNVERVKIKNNCKNKRNNFNSLGNNDYCFTYFSSE